MQLGLPAAEYVPFGHPMHVDGDVAPAADDAFPAWHSSHVADPGSTEYAPAGHSVQLALPCAEYAPAGHMAQVDWLVALTTGDAYPAAQSVQFADPGSSAYDPAGQSAQTRPLGSEL
jgi:hypothetical protein